MPLEPSIRLEVAPRTNGAYIGLVLQLITWDLEDVDVLDVGPHRVVPSFGPLGMPIPKGKGFAVLMSRGGVRVAVALEDPSVLNVGLHSVVPAFGPLGMPVTNGDIPVTLMPT